jgi:hypothetical protein
MLEFHCRHGLQIRAIWCKIHLIFLIQKVIQEFQ